MTEKPTSDRATAAREARLQREAAALRANLHRRKLQAREVRAREAEAQEGGKPPEPAGPTGQ